MERFTSLTYDIQYQNSTVAIYRHRTPFDYFIVARSALKYKLEFTIESFKEPNAFAKTENNGFEHKFIEALRKLDYMSFKKVQNVLDNEWNQSIFQAHIDVITQAESDLVTLKKGGKIDLEKMNTLHLKSLTATSTFINKVIAASK